MSEPKPITEQDFIDKGAFPEHGRVGFHKKTDPGAAIHDMVWTLENEKTKTNANAVQEAVWHAALHWERTSPFSASNKRIAALERVMSE